MPNYFIEPRKLTNSNDTKRRMRPVIPTVESSPTPPQQGPIGNFVGGS
jgi:hypothetical protein